MLFGKGLDLLILLEVGITGVLNIVVKRKDDLTWITDPRCSHRHKLERNWPGVVMSHTVRWRQTAIITAPDELSFGKTDGIALYNLFRQSLRPLFKSRGGERGRLLLVDYASPRDGARI